VLQYAHEHGCPWDEETCAAAAGGDQLECLQYLHEHGCPWDMRVFMADGHNMRNRCHKYATEHGCPRVDWHEIMHPGPNPSPAVVWFRRQRGMT
jgi:hypothetical protein